MNDFEITGTYEGFDEDRNQFQRVLDFQIFLNVNLRILCFHPMIF